MRDFSRQIPSGDLAPCRSCPPYSQLAPIVTQKMSLVDSLDVSAVEGLSNILGEAHVACEWSLAREPGRLLRASLGFAALLQVDARQLEANIAQGLYWSALLDAKASATLTDVMSELREHGRHAPIIISLRTLSGASIQCVVTSSMGIDDPDRVTSLLSDVTRFLAKTAEDLASTVKSRFLAAMTHEFRTPLNAIAGQSSLLLEGVHGPLSEAQRRAMVTIQGASRRLRSIVEDVLTTSRLETGGVSYAMSMAPLQPIVTTAADNIASQCAAKNLGLYIDHASTSHEVWTDPEKLQLIVTALLSNAIKFSNPGSRIIADVATRDDVPEFVYLRVSDTGVGVPRDQIDRIFEPFVQASEGPRRSAEGLGLGLTMCRELARGMGGDVRVRSPESGGAVFSVALRRSPAITQSSL